MASIHSLVVLLLAVLVNAANAQDWVTARATFFGRDGWSLHNGACGFGYTCQNRWGSQLAEGWDVAAISDRSNLNTGSQCGTCLEIKCRDGSFTDNYGNKMDRSGLCLDKSQSVKVKITDSCPCSYPPNAYSNKRWCCNDMPHLDVSEWALEKLVQDPTKWGVFAIDYRQVSCDATVRFYVDPSLSRYLNVREIEDVKIANPAPQIANVPADPHANMKPSNLNCASQGGDFSGSGASSTYSQSKAIRANVHKAWNGKPWYSKVHRHSAFYYARRRAAAARRARRAAAKAKKG